MRVILKEKIANLGKVGDQVTVKRGYGRNYLIPNQKAVLATPENIVVFEKIRVDLEKVEAKTVQAAQGRAKILAEVAVQIGVQASEEGKLFGSIGPRDIVEAVESQGHQLAKSEIIMPEGPIRQLGEYELTVMLHSEVSTTIKVKVVAVGAK